ncbi:alpha-galactosidase [Micromonospora sp. NPDC051300]|uniref:alpha-galactosidase n=1 Tax=Micromonospora sp. NPDC051300 TaxID=3364286 RepID=UPI0037964B97
MNRVELSPTAPVAALHTPTTTYALGWDETEAVIRPLYWGPRISLVDATTIPAWSSPQGDTFEAPLECAEEYPVEGGRRYGVPALAVRFPDGDTGARLVPVDARATDSELVLRFQDAARPLALDLHFRVQPDTDVIERWSTVRHTGSHGTIEVLRHDAAVWSLPVRDQYRMSHVVGAWSAEGTLERVTLPVAETVLQSRRGVTGHRDNPWVMIDNGAADENHGEVWSAALATSGSWRITVARSAAGRCAVHGGAGHEGVVATLAPGASLTSPVFAAARTDGGFGAASRTWHRYQRRHVLTHAGESRPVLYNSWEATTFAVTEAGQLALAHAAAAVGTELFVVDDGWFRGRDSDRAGLGDWAPDPVKFPDGLRPLADEVRRLGMSFGLWVEPEMTNPDSDLFRAHPDWVHHTPDREATVIRHQLVLDYGRADVREWASATLDAVVRDTGATFLKWDFNRPLTEAAPDAWTGHARGVHEVLDRLRAAHPELRIESCASGGGRVDMAILRRTDQVWTSDNTDAVDRLRIQHGYTQMYPPGTMVAWVTDSPNPLTGRRVPLRFRFHVAMAGVLGLGGDLTRWSGEELAQARAFVDTYQEIRGVVQHGALYRLRPPADPTHAVQYVRNDRVVVLAYRVAAQFAPSVDRLPLRGLDPTSTYRDDADGTHHHGAVLLGSGLPLRLPGGPYASTLVRLTRVGS